MEAEKETQIPPKSSRDIFACLWKQTLLFLLEGFISRLNRVLTWASASRWQRCKSAVSSCTGVEMKVFCCPPGVYRGDRRQLSASYKTYLMWYSFNMCIRSCWGNRSQVSGEDIVCFHTNIMLKTIQIMCKTNSRYTGTVFFYLFQYLWKDIISLHCGWWGCTDFLFTFWYIFISISVMSQWKIMAIMQ